MIEYEYAFGAFLGVLCGDAAGATLEFLPGRISDEVAANAMRMPGGGVLRVGKAQITDDSELALSLARGLVGQRACDGFPLEHVARQYANWYNTHPFDIGNTCRTAFAAYPDTDGSVGSAMVNESARGNMMSQANGALMRVLPLALWSVNEPLEQIVAMGKQDAQLSHPHEICQDCNAVYCLMVTYLLKHPGDSKGAIQYAGEYVDKHVTSIVKTWFQEESLSLEGVFCTRSIGHVRWAFVLSVYFLRTHESYERAIHQTLMRGGDTDTNAAIVGGLMGALHGAGAIPAYMKDPVLAFDPQNPFDPEHRGRGVVRPEEYKPSLIVEYTKALVAQSPQ